MDLLDQFINYFKAQKKRPSFLTVKNYKADIVQFVHWFEKEFKLPFDPSKVTSQIIDSYKKTRNLSPVSIERHISSLRKFFSFLQAKGAISHDPLKKTVSAGARAPEDPWMLRNFKSFLYEYKKSNLTIKNYINDIKSFFAWLTEVSLTKSAWDVTERNLLAKINSRVVNEYKQRLITAKFSPRTINRKLSSLRSYVSWAKSQGFIPPSHPELLPANALHRQVQASVSGSPANRQDSLRSNEMPKRVQHDTEEITYSSFPPIRLVQKITHLADLLFDNVFIMPFAKGIEIVVYLLWKVSGKKIFTKRKVEAKVPVSNVKKGFYAPMDISLRFLPLHKKAWHYLHHVRPQWYKKYHSYSITHYFHFAILFILASAVGFGAYNAIFLDMQKGNAILGAVANNSSPRVLSFQGKLTDPSDNPITSTTNILFSIYNDQESSETDFLWQETSSVEPSSDGTFSLLLGKNNPIPDILFRENSTLFLGIKVGDSPELKPRERIATVPFANDSQALQGLEPITNTNKSSNVVLALDSGGNLSIAGSKPHTFQTIGGQFVLSGSTLSLTTTPGSNSMVEIVPDGLGKIDLSKPIQNSTNNNNLSGALGAVEFDDIVAILATSSAESAFNINQNSIGPLISASTSGIAKFVVDNDGTGTFAGDIGVNGADLTSSSTSFNLLNSGVTTLNIGGAASVLNLGVSGGTMNIKSNLIISKDLTLSSFTSNGGIIYTNGSGKISQAGAGSSIDCLLGGASPTFSSCGPFNQTGGAAYTGNSTVDVLFGSSATSSAKFAFININSGTPTASISGDLTLNSRGIIRTTNLQTLTLGDSGTGTIVFSNGGNVGIGTAAPSAKFEVAGGQTKIEVSTQYSQRLCHSGTNGTSTQSVLLGDCDTSQADIAEYYGSKDVTIEPGDVVVAAPGTKSVGPNNKAYVNKSSFAYQGEAIGIVSTNPYDAFGNNFDESEHSFPVALVGRIPVKISLENGPIKAGDLLTSSSIAGVAMSACSRSSNGGSATMPNGALGGKATCKAGVIVGKALEDLDSIDESKAVGFYDPDSKEYRSKTNFPDIPIKSNIIPIVKIYVFSNVSWYDPGAHLAQNGDFIINSTGSNGYSISNSENEILTNIGGFLEIATANIKAGLINASEIITDSLVVTTDTIIVNGQNLKDYIVKVADEERVISPVVSTNQLATNVISPLASDSNISASLLDSKFIIHNSPNASGSAVATIDNQGNASFSGRLSALDGQFENASISGTLRAKKILADSIEGLERFMDIASYSGQFAYVEGLQAEHAQFNQGLMVFGSTSLLDLSIADQLSIGGTMFVTENSIETLGTDLSLQSLRLGGLSIMGGLVYVDTDGNLKVKGDVSLSGKLAVLGDIIASGSARFAEDLEARRATFSKLNFSLIQPVLAVSATEVVASSSAGVAKINPNQIELTIKNKLVTNDSVIYITPVGTPSAQTPFLLRQVPNEPASLQGGSFTVGVQSPTSNQLEFNWLIVN